MRGLFGVFILLVLTSSSFLHLQIWRLICNSICETRSRFLSRPALVTAQLVEDFSGKGVLSIISGFSAKDELRFQFQSTEHVLLWPILPFFRNVWFDSFLFDLHSIRKVAWVKFSNPPFNHVVFFTLKLSCLYKSGGELQVSSTACALNCVLVRISML